MVHGSRWCKTAATLVAILATAPAFGFAGTDVKSDVDDSVAVVAGVGENEPATPPADLQGVLNINEATESQLAMLPGIGPSKARAIVMYRSTKQFKDPRHLVRVRGIGRKTLQQILPLLTVSGPSTLTKVKKTKK